MSLAVAPASRYGVWHSWVTEAWLMSVINGDVVFTTVTVATQLSVAPWLSVTVSVTLVSPSGCGLGGV